MSTNFTVQQMPILEDPIFYGFLIGFLFYIPSFISQFELLIQIRVHRLFYDLSANLLINIGCWVLFLFLGLVNVRNGLTAQNLGAYMMPMLESPYKSSYFILIVGGAFMASTFALSVSILLMTLDRIFALLVPMRHKIHQRSLVNFTVVSCVITFFAAYLLIFIFVPPLSPYTACKTGTCSVSLHFLIVIGCVNVIISLSNIVASIVFNVTLYKHWNKANVEKPENFRQANYFVLVSCLTEVLFRIFPQIANTTLAALGVPVSNFYNFVSTIAGIDALVNALIYRYLIMKRVKRKTTTKVLSVTGSNISNR